MVGEFDAFQWLVAILATALVVTWLPNFHTRRQLLTNFATIGFGDTSEWVTARCFRTITPFTIVAHWIINALLILVAFESGATSNTETTIIPSTHALREFHTMFGPVRFRYTSQARAATGLTAVSSLGLARRNISALHFTRVILLTDEIATTGSVGTIAKLEFTGRERWLTFFQESVLFHAQKPVAAF
jgi:hypothetical protein